MCARRCIQQSTAYGAFLPTPLPADRPVAVDPEHARLRLSACRREVRVAVSPAVSIALSALSCLFLAGCVRDRESNGSSPPVEVRIEPVESPAALSPPATGSSDAGTNDTAPVETASVETTPAEAAPVKTPSVATALGDATHGAITGRVIYQCDPERPWSYLRFYVRNRHAGYLAEAVVAVRGVQENRTVPPNALVVDQEDFSFQPETLAIRLGDEVTFKNSDPHIHNVHTHRGAESFNVALDEGDEYSFTPRRAGGTRDPVVLRCNLHPAMRGWIFVFDHGYFDVSERDGRFRIENVPAGRYELEMHHAAGELWWSEPIEVRRGDTAEVEIRVSPDDKLPHAR